MPVTNTQGAFNTGRDCTLVIITQFGRLDLPNITDFDSKQETAPVKSDRLDGVQMNAELPKGWSGSFSADRGSSGLDDFIAQVENLWYTLGTYVTGTLYQYVLEANGSTSTYQFDNAAFKLTNAGNFKGDTIVKQTLAYMANRRRRV